MPMPIVLSAFMAKSTVAAIRSGEPYSTNRRMVYTCFVSTLLAAALLTVAACGSGDATTARATCPPSLRAAKNRPVIGVSIQNCEAEFFRIMVKGMESEAAQDGYGVDVRDASRDDTTQRNQVQDFIERKVAAIVLTPYDSQSEDLAAVVLEANQSSIPVFTTDIRLMTTQEGSIRSHIASDNIQGGTEAGQLMCTAISHGSVAILNANHPQITSVSDRVEGFKSALQHRCPSVKIVINIDGSGERMKSAAATEDALQAHPDINGVFAVNDDSALGAIEAITASPRSNTITVIGYDAMSEARAEIAKHNMFGDVIQHPDQIGSKAIIAIHDYLAHKPVPPEIRVPVGILSAGT
jgi:ribose transport system substrate-binding protein